MHGGPSEPDVLGLIYNPEWDIIQVTAIGSKDAATGCGADLARQVTRLVPQPDTVWGGTASRTAKVEVGGLTGQARCVKSKGIGYMMFGVPPSGHVRQRGGRHEHSRLGMGVEVTRARRG
ncbi:MAG: hypothetical protein ACOH16_02125 [Propionibacteriaceae bacterium]